MPTPDVDKTSMLPTIKLSSVEDVYISHTGELSVKDLWTALTAENILKLEEIFSSKRFGDGENAREFSFSRPEFISAIYELFESRCFENAANLVFTSALSSVPTDQPVSARSSVSANACPGSLPFTAFKMSHSYSITSTSNSSSSSGSALEGGQPTSGIMTPHQAGPIHGTSEETEEYVKWGDILQQFLQLAKDQNEQHFIKGKQIFNPNPKYFPLPYNKRERVTRIVKLKSPGGFLMLTDTGTINVLNNRFRPLAWFKISVAPHSGPGDNSESAFAAKVEKIPDFRITCCLSADHDMVIIGTTAADLHFMKDSKTSSGLIEIICIRKLPSFATALHAGLEKNKWWIAIGTSAGSTYFLKANQNFDSLLMRADRDKTLSWKETYEKFGFADNIRAHKFPVIDLFYDTQTDTLVSCSKDPKISLLVTRPYSTSQKYNFAIPKGVRYMRTGWKLHLIATICGDSVVRTWNPFVVDSPLMELPPSFAHDPPINLCIEEDKALLIVLFIDSVLVVWSVDSCNPLQTINLKIPGGQKWNPLSKPLVVWHHCLLIAGENYVAIVQFQEDLERADDQDKFFKEDLSYYDDNESRHSSMTTKDEEDYKSNKFAALPVENDITVSSFSLNIKAKEKMKKLVCSGAPFCCLKLFEMQKGGYIPEGLPLPRYFSSLNIASSNSSEIMEHVKPPGKRDSIFIAAMKTKEHR